MLSVVALTGSFSPDGSATSTAASDRVTLVAHPVIASGPVSGALTLSGAVDSGQAGEQVDIEAKECGQPFFHGIAGVTTEAGGRYSTNYNAGISAAYRAVWKGSMSAPVTVAQRVNIQLTRLPNAARTFRVLVVARASFWRKRVLVQQRRSGAWRTIRRVPLTESNGAYAWVRYWADVKLSVPKGTRLRAAVERSQARPCYLAATSVPWRT